jgi:N-acetyl-gamma-glutamylphosphate reductase
MRSAGSNSVHSRNSSSNSLAEPEVASMPGCFPTGASSSNSLVAEAERGMSSGSSSASGTSSGGKRGSGLGRKLRDALAELLISK